MELKCNDRWLRRLPAVAAVVLLGACANTKDAVHTMKAPDFNVHFIVANGVLQRINVTPDGGNGQFKFVSGLTLVWGAKEPFEMKFAALPGTNGSTLGGPTNWRPAAADPSNPGSYVFELNVVKPTTIYGAAKYTVRRKESDNYEYDPVVIVDK